MEGIKLKPFDFGIISYLHSQNDILSSGGSVKTISVSQALPYLFSLMVL